MAWFALGALLLAIGLLLGNAFVKTDPAKLVRVLRITGAAILFGLAVLFAVTGRFGIAGPLVVGALMLLGRDPLGLLSRMSPGLGGMFGAAGAGRQRSSGQVSEMSTEHLVMRLDHDTGALTGEVLKGRDAGRRLDDLDEAALAALLAEYRGVDEESATLLETYLARRFGAGWRRASGAAPGDRGQRTRGPASGMTREEARRVLGVGEKATAEEIRAAHRRLIRKLHPDQGGSDYLAAKINEAKELLLKDRGGS